MSLLTVREAATRLGVAYSTLKQWIYKGSVRTVQTKGGHHRIKEAEVDRLLAQQGKAIPAPRKSRPASGVLIALSGRNRLSGVVAEIRRAGHLAQIRLRVGDQSLTAVITCDALDELRLKKGDFATAIIKATEVMIGREPTVQ